MSSLPASSLPAYVTDADRLSELETYAILDTPSEEGFADTVQLAAIICAVPVALVSFVAANRQWFKARVGFPPCETDLNSSVCAFVLGEADLLVIPDLTQDVRTRNNPLVTGEPFIRFYAGAPLRTPAGHVLGSLCVIDSQPRAAGLTAPQADGLRRLARQTMVLLHERQQVVQLQISEERATKGFMRQAALTEIGDHLRDMPDVSEMTSAAAEIVGRTLGASRAGYGELDEAGEFVTILKDWTAPGSASLVGRHRFAGFGAIGAVIRRGDTLVVRNVATDPQTIDAAAAFHGLDIHAMLNVPVKERGRTMGLFYVHSAKERDWTAEEVGFARNVADRVLVGIGRLRAEEQQAMLNHELSHRMKNMLAMVQAIATQTMRNAADLPAAQAALSARLVTMGKAHDLLLGGARSSASLDGVLREALAIHDDAEVGRLSLDGPFVHVGSKAAMSLALMVHELATNATKYGALLVQTGRVQVTWTIEPAGDGPTLRLRWSEHDGPPVTPPSKRGFGSRLIERGLAGAIGGAVSLSYPPEGLTCDLTAKLAEIEADQ